MSAWSKISATDNFDDYVEELSRPLSEPPPPPAPVPDTKTELIDLAGAVENRQKYIPDEPSSKEARLEKVKEKGFSPPVDVYEPGFRTDLYEAIKNFWREKKKTRDKLDKIREKTGIGRTV